MTSSLVRQAAHALDEGKVVGVPTDTVYGIATHRWAEGELFRLKGRPAHKAIPVLVGSLADAEDVATFTPLAHRLASQHWPGPLTLVLAGGEGTIGVRMPDHPSILELLRATGPLAVTSANRSGEPPALSEIEALQAFGDAVYLYLPGDCPGGVSSTVVESLPGQSLRTLRAGPITMDGFS